MAKYSTELKIDSENTYNIELNKWTTTINVETSSTDFYGKDIAIEVSDGTSLGSISFSNTGTASIDVHKKNVTYSFTVTLSADEVYTQSVSVGEDEQTLTVTLNRWTARVYVSANYADFYGQTLVVSKDGTTIGGATIDTSGRALFTAHEAGTYSFTLNYSDHENYTVSQNVTTDGETYNLTISRWISTVSISTPTAAFYGHEVEIYRNSVAYDTVDLSSSGTASYDIHEAGTYRFVLVYDESESYEQTITVSASGSTHTVTFTRWTATINITTNSSEFYGHAVAVYKDNVEYATVNIGSNGRLAYEVHATGNYRFVLTYSASEVYEQTTSVTAQTSYPVTLNRWTATINISTSSSELVGQALTVSKDGTQIDTVNLPSTTTGTVNYAVHATGTYKFALTYDGTEYSSSAEVTSETTYTVNVSLKPDVVAWTSGSDEDIKAMIDGYYDGKLTLDEIKEVWKVGDARKVTVGAMTATNVGESHRSQEVEMVILDFDHDELASAVNGKTNALITVQQKNCLRDASVTDTTGSNNTEHGYMNSSNTNVNGWEGCARRKWCNEVYYEALPDGFKSMVKKAKHTTTIGNQSSETKASEDWAFLPSEWEVFGATTWAKTREGTQYKYYETAANRYKLPKWNSSDVSDLWWERSPFGSNATRFCFVDGNGIADANNASYARGLAPAVCL